VTCGPSHRNRPDDLLVFFDLSLDDTCVSRVSAQSGNGVRKQCKGMAGDDMYTVEEI
jgi:hypothetical protein